MRWSPRALVSGPLSLRRVGQGSDLSGGPISRCFLARNIGACEK